MCQDSLFCKGPGSAAAFVKQFDRALVDNSVKVGDLLLLTAEQSSESKMFFLGVCTKRPTAHILLHAHIDNGGMCAFSANESGHLEISTSHAMFHKILSHARAAVKEMRVEVWSYVVIHGQEAPFIRVESVDLLKSFTVNLDTKHVKRKPHFKLPFGFKIRKKKKQQHRPKPKPRAKARAELKTSKSADVATDSDREHLASSSSSDSRTGLLNAANGQSEPSSIDGVESEIRPVSELAKQEEATADLLIAEHEACKSAASTAATAVLAYEQKSSFFCKGSWPPRSSHRSEWKKRVLFLQRKDSKGLSQIFVSPFSFASEQLGSCDMLGGIGTERKVWAASVRTSTSAVKWLSFEKSKQWVRLSCLGRCSSTVPATAPSRAELGSLYGEEIWSTHWIGKKSRVSKQGRAVFSAGCFLNRSEISGIVTHDRT